MNRLFLFPGAFFVLALLTATSAAAQTAIVTGFVVEDESNLPIEGVNVLMTSTTDSTLTRGTATSGSGAFTVRGVSEGDWSIRISFVGYERVERIITIENSNLDLGTIRLKDDVAFLDEVRVEAVQERVVVRGDTTEFNAAAFRVNADATTEDLIAKMPGVTVVDGEVTARGETVQKVLVDGREFFGDDPSAALRNLPAEIVDRIQMYERQSDQSRFTGFNDGNEEMTINIVTREGKRNGAFGKAYAGGGTDERYQSGGNLNLFQGTQRLSIVGLSNNINVQNFSRGDLSEVGRSSRDFRSRGQGGINRTHALGLNYANEWSDGTKLSASWFMNRSINETDRALDREYILSSTTYTEQSLGTGRETEHRLSARFEHEINDRQSFILSPRLSFDRETEQSDVFGVNSVAGTTTRAVTGEDSGYRISGFALWRMKFAKEGRTLSSHFFLNANDQNADGTLVASTSGTLVDQVSERLQRGRSLSARASYTEKLSERQQLQLSWNPSWNTGQSDRATWNLDPVTAAYTVRDLSLTGDFDTETMRQRGGISWQFNTEKMRLRAEMDLEWEHLTGTQVLPVVATVDRRFNSVLPSAEFRYEFSKSSNMRLRYRASTDTPGVSQMQDVVDNSDPFDMSAGNPDLEQSLSHSLWMRQQWTSGDRGSVVSMSVWAGRTLRSIGRESFVVEEDTEIAPGVVLVGGGRFSRPANVGNNGNVRADASFGRPVGLLASNLTVDAGWSLSESPALLDGERSVTRTNSVSGGLRLTSNVSERVDFSVGYNLSMSNASNSRETALDRDFSRHRGSARIELLPWGRFVVSSDLSMNRYVGLGATAESTVRWNAGLGWKFLQGEGGELRLMVADILNADQSVSRSINELYIDDRESNVLGRFILLNFTYTVRDFRQ